MSFAEIAGWLRECGLDVDDVALDGVVHRVRGSKSRKKDGWYVGFETPVLVCVAGDWARGSKWTWRMDAVMTLDERREAKRLQERARELAEKERASRQLSVAHDIRRILRAAEPAPSSHPYLQAKQVAPFGAVVLGDVLYIPNRDVFGNVWGAQKIKPDGSKLWHRDQRKSATYFAIGDVTPTSFICEGYATGATIHMATNAGVACAFDTGNLKLVATALREAHPGVEWVIASDDDYTKTTNPGVKAAESAAKAIGSRYVVPVFATERRGTDFNDLAVIEGLEVVKRQLQGAQVASVIDINRARSSHSGDLTFAEFAQAIVDKMQGSSRAPASWPPFPHQFHAVADSQGRHAVLEEFDHGVVVYRDHDAVKNAILRYCWEAISYETNVRSFDAEKAAKVRNMWLGLTTPLEQRPTALLEKSQSGLTFKRLDFDAPAGWDGPTPPLFEEFLNRCSNRLALCAFIGSLFYPEADRQQYLYLYGEGGDGKGALMRLLAQLFGAAATALTPPTKNDKFWNMRLYGKRLGLFFDCDDWNWFSTPMFKSWLGNDLIYFEPKGRDGFSDMPTAKFIAASNSRPRVSSQKSDMRRLIFCHVAPGPERGDPTYETRLAAEAEAIVRSCKDIYLSLCPSHGPIPFDQAKEVAYEAEAQFLDIFWARFAPSDGSVLTGEDVRPILAEAGIKSNRDIGKLKDCWSRLIPGVVIEHKTKGTRYFGMRILGAHEVHRARHDEQASVS